MVDRMTMQSNLPALSHNSTDAIVEDDRNVIAFRQRPSTEDLKRIVMGRSRKAALLVLMNRIRELYNKNRSSYRAMTGHLYDIRL
jgi:hypothetical protein